MPKVHIEALVATLIYTERRTRVTIGLHTEVITALLRDLLIHRRLGGGEKGTNSVKVLLE
jgi:hypothetical protein